MIQNCNTHTCDKCGSGIVHQSPVGRSNVIHFAIPAGENEYNMEMRVICRSCELELLDWIDEDSDYGNRVDLPDVAYTVEALRNEAQTFKQLADKIESMNLDGVNENDSG